jgi:two-component system, OmpR family, response regulator AdeR
VIASDGDTALTHHATLTPDLVLLDVKLPRRDGFDVLAELRRRGPTPVIMATAMADDLDKLSALRMGADDDYVVKPFNALEVVARVKAVLRRTNGGVQAGPVRVGPLEIDMDAYQVRALPGGQPIDLTLTEFRIVAHMARAPRRVFARAELLDACFGESQALERTVDSHISNLRRKLESCGLAGYFAGVRGVGYRLTGGEA